MSRHALNTSFEWRRAAPAQSAPFLTSAQVDQFDSEGYCLVDNAFSTDTIAALTEAIDPWEQRATDFLHTQPGGAMFIAQADSITFTVHLVSHNETCRAFTLHPSLLGIAGDLIGVDVRMYWDQAVYKKPEPEREFPWHQDNGYTFVEPQQYLTCWVPLTDATLDNGCPWVAPGLHKNGTLEHNVGAYGLSCFDSFEGAIPIEAPVGSAVVFSSLTPHRTGPNSTDRVRKAYIVQYAPTGAYIRNSNDPDDRTSANAPDRQYEVLRHGATLS
jgi:ectoine hydroxylase-related dioxygenase (phytanoyl-CoA dioxygenase family)